MSKIVVGVIVLFIIAAIVTNSFAYLYSIDTSDQRYTSFSHQITFIEFLFQDSTAAASYRATLFRVVIIATFSSLSLMAIWMISFNISGCRRGVSDFLGLTAMFLRSMFLGSQAWPERARLFWKISNVLVLLWVVWGAVQEFVLFAPHERIQANINIPKQLDERESIEHLGTLGTETPEDKVLLELRDLQLAVIDEHNRSADEWNNNKWGRFLTYWIGYVVFYFTVAFAFISFLHEFAGATTSRRDLQK